MDVTIQKQILELLQSLQERLGMALLLITHDLTVVRSLAQRICVMNSGRIVEEGNAKRIFTAPEHNYTKHLLAAEFLSEPPRADSKSETIATIDNLEVNYVIGRQWFGRPKTLAAVKGVSLEIKAGHTLGVVGESGSGKTTLGMAILRMLPSEGQIVFMGNELSALKAKEMKRFRKDLQIVFQDPYGSLSPRMTVSQIIGEGLRIHSPELDELERDSIVRNALIDVGLEEEMLKRYPHEFSGGQRQRISIARAIVLRPKLIVMDEPTSALDVSVQAQIVDLLREVQAKYDLVYLFISHDLKVVRALAHYLVVMKNGKVIEQGEAGQVFDNPKEAYTKELMDAAFSPLG